MGYASPVPPRTGLTCRSGRDESTLSSRSRLHTYTTTRRFVYHLCTGQCFSFDSYFLYAAFVTTTSHTFSSLPHWSWRSAACYHPQRTVALESIFTYCVHKAKVIPLHLLHCCTTLCCAYSSPYATVTQKHINTNIHLWTNTKVKHSFTGK